MLLVRFVKTLGCLVGSLSKLHEFRLDLYGIGCHRCSFLHSTLFAWSWILKGSVLNDLRSLEEVIDEKPRWCGRGEVCGNQAPINPCSAEELCVSQHIHMTI